MWDYDCNYLFKGDDEFIVLAGFVEKLFFFEKFAFHKVLMI